MEELKNALQVLKQLSEMTGAGSQKEKQDLIKEAATPLFRLLLQTAMNPFIRTNIKQIEVVELTTFSENSFEKIVEYLQSKRALTTEDRLEVFNFVNSYGNLNTELRGLLAKVLMKKLNIGVGAKLVNKALGEPFLPATEMMKAADDIKVVEGWFKTGKEVWAEFKYDGIRGIAAFEGTMPNCFMNSIKTYNMRDFDLDLMTEVPLQLFKFYITILKEAGLPEDLFLDFEVTGMKRQSVGGEVNRVLQGTAPKGLDVNWVINIFDVESTEVTKGFGFNADYKTRRAWLELAEKSLAERGVSMPNIQLAQRWKVESMEDVQQLFVKIIEEGQEGLVLKCADGKYECKRSKNWIKMKSVNDCDLIIVDWYKGRAGHKREEFGGFTCESADGKLKVNVGGGYTDKTIKYILETDPTRFIGTIMSVKYNMRIKPEDSILESLFLPRFKEFRIDKTQANILSEIKEF